MVTGETYGSQDDYLFDYGRPTPIRGVNTDISAKEMTPLGIGSTYDQRMQGGRGLHPRAPLGNWKGRPQCPNYTGWIHAKRLDTKAEYAAPAGCSKWECHVCGAAKTKKLWAAAHMSWDKFYRQERSGLLTLKMPWKPRWMSKKRFLEGKPRWDLHKDMTGTEIKALAKELQPHGWSEEREAAGLYVQLQPIHLQRLWTAWISNLRARYYRKFKERLEYIAAPEFTKQGAVHRHMAIPAKYVEGGRGEWLQKTWRQIVPGSDAKADMDTDGKNGGYRAPRKDMPVSAGVYYVMKYVQKAATQAQPGFQLRRFYRTRGFPFPMFGWAGLFRTVDGRPINRIKEQRRLGQLYYYIRKHNMTIPSSYKSVSDKFGKMRAALGSRRYLIDEGEFKFILTILLDQFLWEVYTKRYRLIQAAFTPTGKEGLHIIQQPGYVRAHQWEDGTTVVTPEII